MWLVELRKYNARRETLSEVQAYKEGLKLRGEQEHWEKSSGNSKQKILLEECEAPGAVKLHHNNNNRKKKKRKEKETQLISIDSVHTLMA